MYNSVLAAELRYSDDFKLPLRLSSSLYERSSEKELGFLDYVTMKTNDMMILKSRQKIWKYGDAFRGAVIQTGAGLQRELKFITAQIDREP